ncbi:MAG: hypothetical protein H0T79_04625, partial [Deltaproteobacteria bacterium]|nr:hypothetical protein [Deltaproteobacteria bacterium]
MEALLARMLEAWRTSRDPALEDAIVCVGRTLARARGPLVVVEGEASPAAVWFEVAARRDAGDVDRLLDVRWTNTIPAMAPRIAVLAEFPPDPRIARKLAVVARTLPTKGGTAVHTAIVAILRASATPSILANLRVVAAGCGQRQRGLYRQVEAALAERVVSAADPALIAEAHARVGDGRELAALWVDHAADPFDLHRRAVLADALELASDPRGELIQLQLAIADGALDRRLHARVRRLLAVHLDEWIGPLPNVDRDSVRFARGFPVALSCRAGDQDLASAIARHEWRTLEALALGA